MPANVASRRPTISIVAAALVLLAAPSLPAQEIRYGAPVQLADGTMRTYLVIDRDSHPLELGIALSEAALQNLPDLADEEPSLALDLAMPEGNPTPFRFVGAGWMPRGHPPAGVYTVPHFDVHFYLIDPAARDAIVPADTTDMTDLEARGSKAPTEGFIPANYVYPGEATVPQMGGHWIDPASHEFHGAPFDRTFLYGTWDGFDEDAKEYRIALTGFAERE